MNNNNTNFLHFETNHQFNYKNNNINNNSESQKYSQRVRNYEPPKKPKNKHERYLEFKKSLEREPVDKVNTVDGYVVELYEEPRDKTF